MTYRTPRHTQTGVVLQVVGAGLTAAVLVLLVATVVLTAFVGDLAGVSYGAALFLPAVVLAVGALLAWKRPSNPIGWLVLATALEQALIHLARLYAVLDYHLHPGRLPIGAAAVFLVDTIWPYGFIFLPIIILLFPAGLLPSGRWRAALAAYLVSCGVVMASFYVQEVATLRGSFRVDPVSGQSTATVSLHGIAGSIETIADVAAIAIPLFTLACAVRLVASWRGADGAARQQLKWLMIGVVFAVAGALVNFVSNSELAGTTGQVAAVGSNLMVAVLPVSVGVAVLRYRLLFNPLRGRVQRTVDRRFNRVHYDAEALLSHFVTRLRGAVDPETVETGLLAAVSEAVAPAHASIWLSTPTRSPSDG